MAKKNSLRKQVKALESLAGIRTLTAAEARQTNGGRSHHKHKTSSSFTLAIGSGAIVAVKGTGSLLAPGFSGGVAIKGLGH